jgi:hypothetical protein
VPDGASSQISTLVTDADADPQQLMAIGDAGVVVLVAGGAGMPAAAGGGS